MAVRGTQVPPSAAQDDSTRLRLTFLTLLVVSLFVLLFARLWFLQVMAGERYAAQAQGNAVRTISLEAPRGKVLDRQGLPLVDNRYALVVSVQPAEMGDRREEVLADLAELLGVPVGEIRERIERARVSPFRPKPVAFDVPSDLVFYLHENGAARFPGVYAEQLPLRRYPLGDLAAHVLGYVGEISEAELAEPAYADHQPGDLIGWAGVERSYEPVLRGEKGQRRLEVNARGEVLRQIDERLPVRGADLRLTVDHEVQRLAESALRDGIAQARTLEDHGEGAQRGGTYRAPAGAVIVLDPNTGGLVAMASYPSFEPERFVGGVSREYWAHLQSPDSAHPLINRALQSAYPPGSVFKVVSASAALENGYIDPVTRLPCPGAWEWNESVYRNWKRVDSGPLNIVESLVESCDTVYYELARRMWTDEQREGEAMRERLPEQALAWGFGAATGVDLPGERRGVVPSRAWKRDYWERHRDGYCARAEQAQPDSSTGALFAELCEDGHRWRGGDTVNLSIGQGDLQATPLQVANSFAAVANGGTLYRPHVAERIIHADGTVEVVEPEVLGTLPISPEHLSVIHEGLVGVTRPGGTAASVFADLPVPLAGKTGTAEFGQRQPFSWFAAYGPADHAQYVVLAVLEEGGGGSQTAAPIVRRMFEGLLGLQETTLRPGEATE